MTSPDPINQARRSGYGRGWHDCLKAMNKEDPQMTPAREQQQMQALNSQALKVLGVLSPAKAMTIQQVVAAMAENKHTTDVRVVQACLGNLVERGLAEKDGAAYRRALARQIERPEPQPTKLEVVAGTPTQAEPKPDLLSKLSTLAANLRATADSLDDVALEVEERIAAAGKGSEKLRQLQQILRSLDSTEHT